MKKNSVPQYLKDNIFNIFQVGLVILTLLSLLDLNKQINDNRKVQSAQFVSDFYKQLRGKDGFRKLVFDIATEDSQVFKNHDTAEVDSYLVLWESLEKIYTDKLIDEDELYSAFSFDIQEAYKSDEIRSYILATREDYNDSTLYSDFETIAIRYLKYKYSDEYIDSLKKNTQLK